MKIMPLERVIEIGISDGIFPSNILSYLPPKPTIHDVVATEPSTQVDDDIDRDE